MRCAGARAQGKGKVSAGTGEEEGRTRLGVGGEGSWCQVGKTQPQRTDEKSDLYSEGSGSLLLGNDGIKAAFVEDLPGWAGGGRRHLGANEGGEGGEGHTGQAEGECVRVWEAQGR